MEADNTALLEARVTPEIRTYPVSVVVEGKPLLDNLNELIRTGEALGKVERERARLGSVESRGARPHNLFL